MISITHVRTYGWEAAIRGMRNPMNSWDKSDSDFHFMDFDGDDDFIIGENDLALMKKLSAAGTDHAKFRRMITVSMDILAPLYWWKEFDTYKVGTVANSCSTMHKIHANEFTIDDFSTEHLIGFSDIPDWKDGIVSYIDEEALKTGKSKTTIEDVPVIMVNDGDGFFSPKGILSLTIKMLNRCRDLYLATKDKQYWWQMIQLLPSSYNQLRTVTLNYEVLANIYQGRRNHKLDEWHVFCNMIEMLPEAEGIIFPERVDEKEEADDSND